MKYLSCKFCGNDVRVGDETIEVTCYKCLMSKAKTEEKKSDLPLTDSFKIDYIVEMLRKKNISKLREQLNLSIRDMARKLGLTKSVYFRCENGRNVPENIIAKVNEFLTLEAQNKNT